MAAADEVILSCGAYRYRVETGWAQLPAGWQLGDVSSVAVDARDQVYVFSRGEHPVMVFDRDGGFVHAWGEGWFRRAHGIQVGHDGAIYLVDDHAHVVRKCSPDGRILLEIGTAGSAAPYMSGTPFNRCTRTALSPQGDIYVADGYGNARVHKYAPNGTLLRSWGEPGCDPGQFQIVHDIACDADGFVYVADRENHRIQVFDGDGGFRTAWYGLHRPCGLTIAGRAAAGAVAGMEAGTEASAAAGAAEPLTEPLLYVTEIGPATPTTRNIPNLGPRLSIVGRGGRILARLGDVRAGPAAHQFIAPHGVAVDSRGDLYVGECASTDWPRLFRGEPQPERLITLRKLVRLH
ncbi:MAG: peptidyl-alpha-hydroxyglycine alpha-amidating lyase family protein [Lautropia sp.]